MSTSKNAPSAPEATPDKRTDEPWSDVERAGSSSLIAGLPHISSRHPLVAILAGGSRIALADNRSIAMFELTHGTLGGVTATSIWRTEIEGTVSALIGDAGRGLVATIERDGHHRAELIDERGSATTLVALPSRPTATAVAGERFIASFTASPEAPARLVEIDLTTGHRVAERDLESGDIDIATSPSGQVYTLVDRTNRTLLMRSEPSARECPGELRHKPCPCGTSPSHDRQPCCGKHDVDASRRPRATGQGESRHPEPCPPSRWPSRPGRSRSRRPMSPPGSIHWKTISTR